MDQSRSSQRYQAHPVEDEGKLVAEILELVRLHPRYGYRMITAKLRQRGWRVNAKRVYRIWRREGLKVPQKKRKKRRLGSSENSVIRRRSAGMNDVWCWDFIFDRTSNGSALKWLSIVDEFTRENLCLKVDRSITSEDVIDTLAELFAIRGLPNHIRSDNGPEFIATAIQNWLGQLGITTLYIEPGSPWENGYAESFHSRVRDEFLALEEFEHLGAARRLTKAFRHDYNTCRPHSSLNYMTPSQFARSQTSAPARQTEPPHPPSLSPQPQDKREGRGDSEGGRGSAQTLENITFFTQPELS
jgi:putative transposase